MIPEEQEAMARLSPNREADAGMILLIAELREERGDYPGVLWSFAVGRQDYRWIRSLGTCGATMLLTQQPIPFNLKHSAQPRTIRR